MEDWRPDGNMLCSRPEACAYLAATHGLRIKVGTLAVWACSGRGPAFLRSGRQVLYSRADLDVFAKRRLRGPYRSTADADQTSPPEGSS